MELLLALLAVATMDQAMVGVSSRAAVPPWKEFVGQGFTCAAADYKGSVPNPNGTAVGCLAAAQATNAKGPNYKGVNYATWSASNPTACYICRVPGATAKLRKKPGQTSFVGPLPPAPGCPSPSVPAKAAARLAALCLGEGACRACTSCVHDKAGHCAGCWTPVLGPACLKDDKSVCQACWGPSEPAPPPPPTPPGPHSFQFQGRSVARFTPSAGTAIKGVIVAAHGLGNTGHGFCNLINASGLANQLGAAVLCPDDADGACWRAFPGGGYCKGDEATSADVDFLSALVDYGKAQFKAQYAMLMGCSNGGSIAYRFACNSTAAARIDAVTIACQSWYYPEAGWENSTALPATCAGVHLPFYQLGGTDDQYYAKDFRQQWSAFSTGPLGCSAASLIRNVSVIPATQGFPLHYCDEYSHQDSGAPRRSRKSRLCTVPGKPHDCRMGYQAVMESWALHGPHAATTEPPGEPTLILGGKDSSKT